MRIVLYVLAAFIIYQILIRLIRKVFHFPAPAFIGRFLDSNIRRAMQPPAALIRRSGIQPGMRVLEIGCGSGAYTLEIARAVGATGKVVALDIQPGMLEQLKNKLTRSENTDIRNVEPLLASAYQLPFQNGSFDAAFMITVLQEIPDKWRALAEVRRTLRPGGIVAVTEWLFDPDYPLKQTTLRLLKEAGFENIDSSGNLWTYTVRGYRQ
ncbi:MAG: class I SAM-dependent methyltransferase [Spirochaetales bacterium]|nr:class I SAM-dependent methyltransferase [Spirochaetales bacterium]